MPRFVIPEWVPASDELAAVAAAKTFERVTTPWSDAADRVGELQRLITGTDVDAAYAAAVALKAAADVMVEALRPDVPTARPATPQQSSGSLERDPRYLAAYYWTRRHMPADLQGVKYRDCKTDPRIRELWAQGEALWDDGRITTSGVPR